MFSHSMIKFQFWYEAISHSPGFVIFRISFSFLLNAYDIHYRAIWV